MCNECGCDQELWFQDIFIAISEIRYRDGIHVVNVKTIVNFPTFAT